MKIFSVINLINFQTSIPWDIASNKIDTLLHGGHLAPHSSNPVSVWFPPRTYRSASSSCFVLVQRVCVESHGYHHHQHSVVHTMHRVERPRPDKALQLCSIRVSRDGVLNVYDGFKRKKKLCLNGGVWNKYRMRRLCGTFITWNTICVVSAQWKRVMQLHSKEISVYDLLGKPLCVRK